MCWLKVVLSLHPDIVEKVFKVSETPKRANLQRRIHNNLNAKNLGHTKFTMTMENSSKRVKRYQKTQHCDYQGECNGTKYRNSQSRANLGLHHQV